MLKSYNKIANLSISFAKKKNNLRTPIQEIKDLKQETRKK